MKCEQGTGIVSFFLFRSATSPVLLDATSTSVAHTSTVVFGQVRQTGSVALTPGVKNFEASLDGLANSVAAHVGASTHSVAAALSAVPNGHRQLHACTSMSSAEAGTKGQATHSFRGISVAVELSVKVKRHTADAPK